MGNAATQHRLMSPAWARRRTVMGSQSAGWRTARWLVVGLLVALVGVGCGGDQPAAPLAHIVDDPGVVHVHGLGINPADGALYAATHTGLLVVRGGGASRVANRYQDTMGFTVVGADRFLGSGHPDVRDTQLYQPGRRPLLLDWKRRDVLWAMTDDGQFWQSRDAGGSWVQRGKLNGQPEALLAHGADLYVAVAQLGIVASADKGRTWRVLYQPAPPAG